MFVLASIMSLINQVAGTPYVVGGDSPAGTDCSGLVSWIANTATGRPAFGDRFHTANEEAALLERGFQYGTAPNALVIGWNEPPAPDAPPPEMEPEPPPPPDFGLPPAPEPDLAPPPEPAPL
ncbi:C40 family peptidase [Mycolicibacillus parakoreensis]|nr:C40 family peptidase [Mycolicibacillus parakoreensis]